MQTREPVQVHYDYASKTALVVCGRESRVLRNIASQGEAEDKARVLASPGRGEFSGAEDAGSKQG